MKKKNIKRSTKAIQQLIDSGVVISLFKNALNMPKASDKKVKKIVAKMVIKQLKKLEDKDKEKYIVEEVKDGPIWNNYIQHESDKTDDDKHKEDTEIIYG